MRQTIDADTVRRIKDDANRIRQAYSQRFPKIMEKGRLFAELGELSLTYKIGGYKKCLDGVSDSARYRKIECAIVHSDGNLIAMAGFNELKTTREMDDNEFFFDFDAVEDDYSAAALAFLSGWRGYEAHVAGNVSVLDYLVSFDAHGSSQWRSLLNSFIEKIVFKNAFVLMTNPWPYKVTNIIDEKNETEALLHRAQTTHLAAWRLMASRFGFIKFDGKAKMDAWMYRLRDANCPEPEFINFNVGKIGYDMRFQAELDEDDAEYVPLPEHGTINLVEVALFHDIRRCG